MPRIGSTGAHVGEAIRSEYDDRRRQIDGGVRVRTRVTPSPHSVRVGHEGACGPYEGGARGGACYHYGVSVLSESSPGSGSGGRGRILLAALVALVVVAAAVMYFSRSAPPETPPAEIAATPDVPAAAPAPREEPAPPAPAAPVAPAPRRPAPPPPEAAPEPAPTIPTRATLTVETDVPGASVFIDREFAGTTPLTLEDLEPGSRRLNLSVEGFDAVARTVTLAPGPNEVEVRFREVRLEAKLPVVHKHRIGSCNGTLVASVDGLQYQTSNQNDAFRLAFDQIETFVIDYLDNNLRVKQRGGRTWNFTDEHDNADPLFVFHRDVQAARDKLAQGYAPVK